MVNSIMCVGFFIFEKILNLIERTCKTDDLHLVSLGFQKIKEMLYIIFKKTLNQTQRKKTKNYINELRKTLLQINLKW